MGIHEIIDRICRIPETPADKVVKHPSRVAYPEGYHILEAGKIRANTFFIERGTARTYIPVDGEEVAFWTGKEGSAIASLKSHVDNQQGYESMELMESSMSYLLKRRDLHELFRRDIHIANWGRKFVESEFLQAGERLISLLFITVSERYMKLIQNNPGPLQRIPLECLASYLGVTSVGLSRVRAKLKRVL